jgi:zinc/manganese transport system substrate-binding protein
MRFPTLRSRRHVAAGLVVLGSLVGAACSSDSGAESSTDGDGAAESIPTEVTTPDTGAGADKQTVVVTYSILGSLVADLIGESAEVKVLVPNGLDPHDFEPSARDVETLTRASIVVANGLDLEEGLEDALEEAEKSGTPVFHVTDHVTLRSAKDEHSDEGGEHSDEGGEHSDEGDEHSDEGDEHSDHDHGSEDPHVWLDPLTLAEAVPAMATEIGSRIGVDLSASAEAVVRGLTSLHEEIAAEIGTLDTCILLTGHDSFGYFGARYGCEIVGSIVPGFSTAAEATAGELAELKKVAESEGVKAVFTEQGTPREVAEQMANELTVDVVELPNHRLPDGGEYADMMENIARTIVDALA